MNATERTIALIDDFAKAALPVVANQFPPEEGEPLSHWRESIANQAYALAAAMLAARKGRA